MHKHRCSKCACIWEHDEQCATSVLAHLCPRCGKLEVYHYTENQPPSFAQQCMPASNKLAEPSITGIILLGYTPVDQRE